MTTAHDGDYCVTIEASRGSTTIGARAGGAPIGPSLGDETGYRPDSAPDQAHQGVAALGRLRVVLVPADAKPGVLQQRDPALVAERDDREGSGAGLQRIPLEHPPTGRQRTLLVEQQYRAGLALHERDPPDNVRPATGVLAQLLGSLHAVTLAVADSIAADIL